jgi:hypothetical protein
MKITADHIGKKVSCSGGIGEPTMFKVRVLAVAKDNFIGVYHEEGEETLFRTDAKWELVEEGKKPSDRIEELAGGSMEYAVTSRQISAILDYLDEQHANREKGK